MHANDSVVDHLSWPTQDIFTFNVEHRHFDHLEFDYSRLDKHSNEIRLLEILPRSSSETICCRLTTWTISQTPLYSALSYTWGGPSTDCTIELNGKVVTIHKNLYRFLSWASSQPRCQYRYIWIDMLCINQKSSAERTHQVGLMTEIYKTAASVIIWLGPAYNDSRLAMRTLSRAPQLLATRGWIAKLWWRPEGCAIRRLCERGYWTRLWVLQELTLAKSAIMVCGDSQISWDDFREFIVAIHDSPAKCRGEQSFEYQAMLQSPAVSMVLQSQGMHQGSLFDRMCKSGHLGCSDMRDKVYALLGIVSSGQDKIRPDYEIGLAELLNNVLRNEHRHHPPQSLVEVRDQCMRLASAVGADADVMFHMEGTHDGIRPPTQEDMKSLPLLDTATGLTLWWAGFYRHRAVGSLWWKWHDDCDELIPGSSMTQERSRVRDFFWPAVRSGSKLAIVEMLLDLDVMQVNSLDNENRSLPHVATEYGCNSLVKILLSKSGIETNIRDLSRRSVLHVAVRRHRQTILKMLVNHPGVEINRADEHGYTALHYAAEIGNVRAMQVLLKSPQVDINITGHFSWKRQIMIRCDAPLTVAIRHRQKSAVRLLLNRDDLKLTSLGTGDDSPLHLAISKRAIDIVEILIRSGKFDINARNNRGHTALFRAAGKGNQALTELLLTDTGIDIEAQTDSGRTALYAALSQGHEAVAAALLQQGLAQINDGEVRRLRRKLKKDQATLDISENASSNDILPDYTSITVEVG